MATMQREHDLLILVDATASMGQYLDALRKSLPQILALSTLTDCFSRIGIIAYRDYDQVEGRIVEWSGWQDNHGQGADITQMAANLLQLGGRSWDEAVKTGLAKAHEVMRDDAETLILLYADAPPHNEFSRHDDEAELERKALSQPRAYNGSGSLFVSWPSACHTMAGEARVISILDSKMTSDGSIYFYYLSLVTGGTSIRMSTTSSTDISQVTMNILIAWMGVSKAGTDIDHELSASPANIIAFTRLDRLSEGSAETQFMYEGGHQPSRSAIASKDLPHKATPVQDFGQRYTKDASFRQHVAVQLTRIIDTDVTAISLNAVFGSLWRAVCNDRRSEHREGLLSAFGAAIERIAYPNERSKMKEWLEASCDYTAEVTSLIENVPEEKRFPCVCLDPTLSFSPRSENMDKPDKTNGNTTLSRADLLEIGRSCDPRILSRLGRCLTQLTYLESEKDLPPHVAAVGLDRAPRIPTALAGKEYSRKFWKILLHLVVPGTMLSARPAAVLAALALKMGVRPLLSIAGQELMLWRDRWTESLDFPETWNVSCLSLLLDANQAHRQFEGYKGVHGGSDLLKREDKRLFENLVAYKALESNLDTTLVAKLGYVPEKRSLPVGPMVRCARCDIMRSVTIMGPEHVCGMCAGEAPEGHEVGEQSEPAWVECVVQDCRAQYVVYRPNKLNVRPKCFQCRQSHCSVTELIMGQWVNTSSPQGGDGSPIKHHSSREPSSVLVECCVCLNRMIYPQEYRPEGFNGDIWRCVSCQSGKQSIVDIETTARDLAAQNGTSWLLANEELLSKSFGTNRSLFSAVSTLGIQDAFAIEILPPRDQPLTLAGKALHNTPSIREQLQRWLDKRTAEKELAPSASPPSANPTFFPPADAEGAYSASTGNA
ncbi:hypothetical protein H2203_000693 [Taxawa tesnikishii (nom. ined.)]|nr:hypothetical protein H2203_000693 [Dothideales sp. JES 119]